MQNIICAVLLLYMSEEEVFWALSTLVEEILPGYYTPGIHPPPSFSLFKRKIVSLLLPYIDMLGSITDQRVFEELLSKHFSVLNHHLKKMEFPLALITFPWFLCLFIGYLPFEVHQPSPMPPPSSTLPCSLPSKIVRVEGSRYFLLRGAPQHYFVPNSFRYPQIEGNRIIGNRK